MPRYVFNPITLRYEVREEPRYAGYLRTAGTLAAAAGLCFLYLWIYTSVLGWDLPKTARLKRENARWQARIALVQRQLDVCEETLSGIEERDDNVYRSIFGLNVIPEEARQSMGDPGEDPLVARINSLGKRAYVQTMALDEVYGNFIIPIDSQTCCGIYQQMTLKVNLSNRKNGSYICLFHCLT